MLIIILSLHSTIAESYLTMYGCSGANISIECALPSVIAIVRANYGRISPTVCTQGPYEQGGHACMQRRTKSILDQRWGQHFLLEILILKFSFPDVQPKHPVVCL